MWITQHMGAQEVGLELHSSVDLVRTFKLIVQKVSLGIQWFWPRGAGLIPTQGTKIPHASQDMANKIKYYGKEEIFNDIKDVWDVSLKEHLLGKKTSILSIVSF